MLSGLRQLADWWWRARRVFRGVARTVAVGSIGLTVGTGVSHAQDEGLTFTFTPVLHQGAICLSVSWSNPSGTDFLYTALARDQGGEGMNREYLDGSATAEGRQLGVPNPANSVTDCTIAADLPHTYLVLKQPTAGAPERETAGSQPDVYLPKLPQAPAGVTYTPPTMGNSPMGRLAWDELSTAAARGYVDITGYEVQYRIGSNVDWIAVSPAHSGVTRQYDDGVVWKLGTTLHFRVRALNAVTSLLPNATVTWGEAMHALTGTVPGAVTLAAEAPVVQGGETEFPARLSWTAASDSPLGYVLYRTPVSASDGPLVVFRSDLASTVTTFDDALSPGQTVEYRVQAYNLSGGGGISEGVRVESASTPAEVMPGSLSVSYPTDGWQGSAAAERTAGRALKAGEISTFTHTSVSLISAEHNNRLRYGDEHETYRYGGDRRGYGFRVGRDHRVRWVNHIGECVGVLFCGLRRPGYQYYPAGNQVDQWLVVWRNSDDYMSGFPSMDEIEVYVPTTVSGSHDFEFGYAEVSDTGRPAWFTRGAFTAVIHQAGLITGAPVRVMSLVPTVRADSGVQLDWTMTEAELAGLKLERRNHPFATSMGAERPVPTEWQQVCCRLAPAVRSYVDRPALPAADQMAEYHYRLVSFYADGQSIVHTEVASVVLTADASSVVTGSATVDTAPRFADADQDRVFRYTVGEVVDESLATPTGGDAPFEWESFGDLPGVVGLTVRVVSGVPRLQGTATAGDIWGTTRVREQNDESDAAHLRYRVVVGSPPGVPRQLTGFGGVQRIVLSWLPPVGVEPYTGAVTGYRIEWSADGTAGSWAVLVHDTETAATAYVNEGVRARYVAHYRVAAINESGPGAFSDAVRVVAGPPAPAGPPTITVASTQVLTWRAPDDDGGSPITGYQVQYSLTGVDGSWRILVDDTGSTHPEYRIPVDRRWVNWVIHYRVAARNLSGVGLLSQTVEVQESRNRLSNSYPRNVEATGGRNKITLHWEPDDVIGTDIITGYLIESTVGGDDFETLVANTGNRETSYVHTGLTGGQRVRYRLRQLTTLGPSTLSLNAEATTRPWTVPGAPPAITATARHGSILVEWVPPMDDGNTDITGYQLQHSATGDDDSWMDVTPGVTGAATSYEHTGRTAGEDVYYHVAAINSEGTGGFSVAVSAASLADQPRAPTLDDVSWSPPTFTVRFTAPTPSMGDAAITGYRVQSSAAAVGGWMDFADFTVAELVAGVGSNEFSSPDISIAPGDSRLPLPRYFRLRAMSASGDGVPSNVLCVDECTPSPPMPTAPGMPTDLVAGRGSGQIILRWAAPAEDGGSPITGYHIRQSSDGQTWTDLVAPDAATPATVYYHTGLAGGTTVHYQVAAINAAGKGSFSNESVSATTRAIGVPTAPRWTATHRGVKSVPLNWIAPESDGGSAITGYRVENSEASRFGPWSVVVADTGSVEPTYTHMNLPDGYSAYYRVAAINAGGVGAWAVRSTTTGATAPLGAGPTLAVFSGRDSILLDWQSPGSGIAGGEPLGYRIERSTTETGPWSVVMPHTFSQRTRWRDTGQTEHTATAIVTARTFGSDTSFFYRVGYINSQVGGRLGGVAAQYSTATAGALSQSRPSPPRQIQAVQRGANIEVSWMAPEHGANLVTGYQVERSLDDEQTWAAQGWATPPTAATTGYTDSTLGLNEPAVYRVTALAAGGMNSTPDGYVVAQRQAAVPRSPVAVRVATFFTYLQLSWAAVPTGGGFTITKYEIQHAPDPEEGSWRMLAEVNASEETTYRHDDPGAESRYYRIAAVSDMVSSGFSVPVAGRLENVDVALNFTNDDVFTEKDAAFLYLVLEFPELLGDGMVGTGFASFRMAMMDELFDSPFPAERDLRDRIADALRAAGRYGGTEVDVNEDGNMDINDALIFYYAFTAASALGDGTMSMGDADIRATLLTPLADDTNPVDDAALRDLLENANFFKPE